MMALYRKGKRKRVLLDSGKVGSLFLGHSLLKNEIWLTYKEEAAVIESDINPLSPGLSPVYLSGEESL